MKKKLLVFIVMGSQSDWRVSRNAADILSEFKVTFEKKIDQHIEHLIDYTSMQNY